MSSYTDVALFPELEHTTTEPVEKLSADRRRTLRQREDVARGVHPLVGGPLNADPDAKCGNCVHRQVLGHHDQLQSQVISLAKLRGCIVYHTHLSIRSEPGFPDLVVAGTGLVLFRELKTDKGRISAAQQVWLDTLIAGGADAGVWRPIDLADGRIMRELAPSWAKPTTAADGCAGFVPRPGFGNAHTCKRCGKDLTSHKVRAQ